MDSGDRLLKEYKKFIGVYKPDDILRYRPSRDLRQAAEPEKVTLKDDIVAVLEKLPNNRYRVVGEREGYFKVEDRFVTFEIDGRDWEKAV